MQKTLFKYQKWYLRLFCAGIGFPGILAIQLLFAKLMDIEYPNFWYICICAVVMLVWLYIYYAFTQRHKLFERTGSYWIENEIVYIQKGKQIFEIKNVQWLRGTTVSVYGLAKSAMLVINFEKQKIIFISSSATPIENFSDSELIPLFKAVLEYNAELKKDDTIEFWYEVKKQ